jgi:hypothetical protein
MDFKEFGNVECFKLYVSVQTRLWISEDLLRKSLVVVVFPRKFTYFSIILCTFTMECKNDKFKNTLMGFSYLLHIYGNWWFRDYKEYTSFNSLY